MKNDKLGRFWGSQCRNSVMPIQTKKNINLVNDNVFHFLASYLTANSINVEYRVRIFLKIVHNLQRKLLKHKLVAGLPRSCHGFFSNHFHNHVVMV